MKRELFKMKILVVAEHDNFTLKPSTYNTVGAAQKIGGEIHVIVAGSNCSSVAQSASRIMGITTVLLIDHPSYLHQLPEDIAPLLVKISSQYTHIIAPSSSYGKNLLPRAAALLDKQQISDVIAVISADTFKRPVYAGNAIATIQSTDSIKIFTARGTSFDPAISEGGNATTITLDPLPTTGLSTLVSEELSASERPELTVAKIVVSGGRGLGSAENFALIEQLADKLNAAIGASRAAVDAGYIANDYQVGQTGKVVAPELYIAIGISGAIQHLAGMKDSKIIVAINKDPDAPIFTVADYGLVADLFDAIPEILSKL